MEPAFLHLVVLVFFVIVVALVSFLYIVVGVCSLIVVVLACRSESTVIVSLCTPLGYGN